MKHLLTLSLIMGGLVACAPTPPAQLDGAAPTASLEANPNEITLSNYTQEQQARDRAAYAQRLQEIAAQREEVTGVSVPSLSTANPAAFARTSSNAVGQAIYPRSGGRRGSCSGSAYEAQRRFLEAGGPVSDTLGLDPDGDGFACQFNPAPYRTFSANGTIDGSPWN